MSRVTHIRDAEQRDFGFFNALISLVRARRKVIYTFAAVAFVTSFTFMMLMPNSYTSTARITPALASSSGDVSPLVGSIMQEVGTMAPLLPRLSKEGLIYIVLLKSPRVTDSVLRRQYVDQKGIAVGNLYDVFDIRNPEKARRKLLTITSFDCDIRTGMVTISATSHDPVLSAQIANALVEKLDLFKQELDRSMAGKVSGYLQDRLDDEQQTLQKAEEEMARFLSANRNYQDGDDPELRLEVDRLQRNVAFHRQFLTTLMELKATTDMETEKTIPRLVVIQNAEPPSLKSSPHRITTILLATLAAALFAIGLTVVQLSYERYFPAETREEVSSSCGSVRDDVRNAMRRVRFTRRISERTGDSG